MSRDLQRYYDKYASSYDTTFNKVPYIAPNRVAQRVASLSVKKKRPLVLDLGCGTGLTGKAIKDLAPFVHIDGADISPKSLEMAKKKCAYRNLIQCDVFDTRASGCLRAMQNSSCYDVACAVGVLEYLEPTRFHSWLSNIPAKHIIVTLPITGGIEDIHDYKKVLETLPHRECEIYPGWHYDKYDKTIEYAQVLF